MATQSVADTAAYRLIWRWHFYAGLFVLPFILILSVTGSIYLFKPQIDRWEEHAFRNLGTAHSVSADQQLVAAETAFPAGHFNHYRLPERAGDAAMIQLSFAGGGQREVYVSPQGRVLGTLNPERRASAVVARIHGSLLLGAWGDRLVELAASWTIVMVLTGLYLWWPRPFALAGTVWPRLSLRGRPLLKDLHRIVGFWIAGLVLVMLASGLPWAGTWGTAFKWARAELGLVSGEQGWKIGTGGGHAGHGHDAMAMSPSVPVASRAQSLPLSTFVSKARSERMAFPVLVLPPHAPQRFGPPTGEVWTVKSEAQNRWLARRVIYDPGTGRELGRDDFSDQHMVDRVVNTGVAWHEGQLFGWVNQLIGVMTAIALMAVSMFGVWMWLHRRPRGEFGAPPKSPGKAGRVLIVSICLMAVLLPLFGLSAIVILAAEATLSRVGRG